MFIHRTNNGALVNDLGEEEGIISNQAGYKIKLLERAGRKLGKTLIKSDPFGGGDCGRDNYFQCLTKPITCKWVPC